MLKQVDAPGVVLMANAYTPASTYAYALRRYVPVFGVGKFHARQDDLLVDYRSYQGQTIRIIRTERPKLEEYSPYFDTVELLTFQQSGLTFYAVEGQRLPLSGLPRRPACRGAAPVLPHPGLVATASVPLLRAGMRQGALSAA